MLIFPCPFSLVLTFDVFCSFSVHHLHAVFKLYIPWFHNGNNDFYFTGSASHEEDTNIFLGNRVAKLFSEPRSVSISALEP